MIAVRFQIGVFQLDTRRLVEANKGFVLMDAGRLCLVGDIEEPTEECYVWHSIDDVIDMYVDQSRTGGGLVIENTRTDDGRNLLKVDIAKLGQRFNVIFEEVE